MKVGIVGLGRMGTVLAAKLAGQVELRVFDHGAGRAERLAAELSVQAAESLAEIAGQDMIILTLPDQGILNCIQYFNDLKQPVILFNAATNVSKQMLEQHVQAPVRCIGVKFIGHAGEMAWGAEPTIIVEENAGELTDMAVCLFCLVGNVIVGRSDLVTSVNIVAAEAALAAAVQIEENLRLQGVYQPAIVKSAIAQVAAGILKSYAANDLGPFALKVVDSLKSKLK